MKAEIFLFIIACVLCSLAGYSAAIENRDSKLVDVLTKLEAGAYKVNPATGVTEFHLVVNGMFVSVSELKKILAKDTSPSVRANCPSCLEEMPDIEIVEETTPCEEMKKKPKIF
jgi:hypothetical protein